MRDDKGAPAASAESDTPAGPLRPAGDAPDNRACLACGQPFLSEGWHNRLCPRCRKRSEPDGW